MSQEKSAILLKEFPKEVKFKYNWRKYQKRVLDELESHMEDGHLHVIAPPGSGKTVLGLEVARKLNKPTLILAPTLAIRNQWIQRYCDLFLQSTLTPAYISRDIRKPRFMTVVTYQALHAACNNLKEADEDLEEENAEEDQEKFIAPARSFNRNLKNILKGLEGAGVETIVVDEAHHLKNEWWKSLIEVKDKLNAQVVGLTATPPYDVSYQEWQRYIALNGPVDAEITVPELVAEGDLCPHQDYVYCSMPTEVETEKIVDFRRNIITIFEEIKTDSVLLEAIQQHPFYLNPHDHLDGIYNDVSHYASCLIFLKANNKQIPKAHLEIIGDINLEIPALDYKWMEVFLSFYIFKEQEHFLKYEVHRQGLENKLKRFGVIERKQIDFRHSKRIDGYLSSSANKLKAIEEIVAFEHHQLGSDLRMVILTDFIRKELTQEISANQIVLNKIGVMPIFEMVRRRDTPLKVGVLTGSVIIIPLSALSILEAVALGLDLQNISTTPLSYDSDYLQININESIKHDVVHLVTQVFERGGMQVLVGTKSLLGEGWDAPFINSLVLASFVGSFVLSNQMRGRAIRAQQGNEMKTSSIWHLACVDLTSPDGGDDLELMRRRFKSFVGVSFGEDPGIENGTLRLNFPDKIASAEQVYKYNESLLRTASERVSLKDKWGAALEKGTTLVEEIKIPFQGKRSYQGVKKMYYNRTIGYMIAELVSVMLLFTEGVFNSLARSLGSFRSLDDFYIWLTVTGLIGTFFFGGKLYFALGNYIRFRDITKDVQQIGNALLASLIKAGQIHTACKNLEIKTEVDYFGAVYCHLEGGTTYEKSLFINTLQEVIGLVDNPRYVIIRKSLFMRAIQQHDYHSVPEILGRNKKLAEYFRDQWENLVGKCELIFTRNIEGRKLILKARVKALASQFEEDIEHVNKWR